MSACFYTTMNWLLLLNVILVMLTVFVQSKNVWESADNFKADVQKVPTESKDLQDQEEAFNNRVLSNKTMPDADDQDNLQTEPDMLDKIVDGQFAYHGEFPWQASIDIYINGKLSFCGATILNEYWLLSAAHCFRVSASYRVIVGNHHRTQQDQGEQSFEIQGIFRHEMYAGQELDFDNDIALVKIKPAASGRGIQFNQYVRAASLPENNASLPEGARCSVSGWGKIRTDATRLEDVLKKVEVPLVNQQVCQQLYAYHPIRYVPQHMFCAGYPQGGGGSCQGDSGGGVFCNNGGVNILYGIVSWGTNCEQPGYPGVYTRVPAYVSWIRSTMEANISRTAKE